MKIGFTGTSRGAGMSPVQCQDLARRLLQRFANHTHPVEAHHGLCIKGDEQFHEIIRELFPKTIIVGHPGFPEDSPWRSKAQCDIVRPIPLPGILKPPIRRNHNIVDEVQLIYVAPFMVIEALRSGTWATYRYAKSMGLPYEMIWPEQ